MTRTLALLIVLSGAVGLVYQVLWMRLFALVFGNTAYAASSVLAGFLLGLALGYLLIGSRRGVARPLQLYGTLEIATGLAALPIPWILDKAQAGYPDLRVLLETITPTVGLLLAAKALLALLVLLPASICMGGTLPALSDAVVRQPSKLGRLGGAVYALNILGGMIGGMAAGFWLPAAIGVQRSYLLAVGLNLLIGVAAWALSARERADVPGLGHVSSPSHASRLTPHASAPVSGVPRVPPHVSFVLAGLSGFAILGLEVLWTRMFAQVLQNSVYSYAAIVVTVLGCLAMSAALVSMSSRARPVTPTALTLTALLAGVATVGSPFAFHGMTQGLEYQGMSQSWWWYLTKLFTLVTIVIGPAVVLGGMVLPLTWRLWESHAHRPGFVVGRTSAVNTFSAVAGALLAGFMLLPAVGLWRSIMLLGALWFVAGAVAGIGLGTFAGSRVAVASGAVAVLLVGGTLVWASQPSTLPLVRLNDEKGERLLEVREGSQGIVAVVDRPAEADRRLKVDNFYTLGGVAARDNELLEGQLPLLLHPHPERVVYIGSATGISPAGALNFPVKEIVAVELIPEVIDLARRHFSEANERLYDDPRVRPVAEDGRNFLLGTRDRFDVIVADLFIPWHAGTGAMYSQEQFQLARSRLAPGGLFCQWLPLYQLSPEEFDMIAATFVRVFPQTSLWRGDFYADRPIVALIGHRDPTPVPVADLEARLAHVRASGGVAQKLFRDVAGVLMLYAGNLTLVAERFAEVPSNTDDRPRLEYLAPRILGTGGREPVAGKEWFVGQTLSSFYRELHAAVLEGDDPLFPDQTMAHRQYRMAGEFFYTFNVLNALGQRELTGPLLERVVELLPESLYQTSAGTERP